MARYIDVDLLRCVVLALSEKQGMFDVDTVLEMINAVKPEDVQEVKNGQWIEYNYPGAECVYCSKCKEQYYLDDLLLGGNDYPKFCPNCGAKMDGERG